MADATVTVTQADIDRAAEYLAALLPELPRVAERVKANGVDPVVAAHAFLSLGALLGI